jgi:hypothetical protein
VAISYIRDVIGALLRGEFREHLGDGFDECIECPRCGLLQGGFQLCKGLFDRVQVGSQGSLPNDPYWRISLTKSLIGSFEAGADAVLRKPPYLAGPIIRIASGECGIKRDGGDEFCQPP